VTAKRKGPESEFLDRLKGKQIGIILSSQKPDTRQFLRCKLLWVDKYSYGVEEPTGEKLIPKHAVQGLFLVEGTGYERA